MSTKHKQLPQEVLPHSTKLIQTILFLLCPWLIFFLANLGANFYLKNFPENVGYWLIKEKWSMLLNLEKPIDWLVLGDSSCNQGVIPQILETELSGKAVNLCTIGNSLVLNSSWMLSKHIQKYGAPKNIILINVYNVWAREINWNVTSQTPLAWGYWNQLEPNLQLSLPEQKAVFLNKYIPLYSQNTSLKNILRSRDRLFQAKFIPLEEKGFMAVTEADIQNVELDAQRNIEALKNTDFSLSTTNQKSLEAIVELAERHKFNVYIANSPLYQELYQNQDFQVYYHQVQDKLQKYSDRSNNVHLIMTKPMTFRKEEMENADHLIVSSAKSYTRQLAEEIKKLQQIKN